MASQFSHFEKIQQASEILDIFAGGYSISRLRRKVKRISKIFKDGISIHSCSDMALKILHCVLAGFINSFCVLSLLII